MVISGNQLLDDIKMIDTDTHVIEPPDLWTSRLPGRWHDLVPHVRWDEATQEEAWYLGGTRGGGIGAPAAAGWPEWPPDGPRRWSEVSSVMWDASERARMMDRDGFTAQVLYPNVAVFGARNLMDIDSEIHLGIVRAYNDFLVEWSSSEPGRYIPIAMLPFWDLELATDEMVRCAEMGHKGMLFTQDPTYFGLPPIGHRHWDPIWAQAQELGFPVNFHIATAGLDVMQTFDPDMGRHANMAVGATCFFMTTGRTIGELIGSGVCHRFPQLNFVSVESGVGWLPFYISSLDWQWRNTGVVHEHPEYDLLPSEYFRRQIYGCFWFEGDTARDAIDILGPNNILFETDFPHATSLTPGPASASPTPREHLAREFADLPESSLRAILHDNAARIYHVGAEGGSPTKERK